MSRLRAAAAQALYEAASLAGPLFPATPQVAWLMYEAPDIKFEGLAMRFMDIRK